MSQTGLEFGYCQKYNKKIPLDENTDCVHPHEYCRFRASCIINELGKENRRRKRMAQAGRLGVLYGIGVGPGDPSMITLQAIDCLKRLDVIFASKKAGVAESIAHTVVKEHLSPSAEVRFLEFQATYDREAFDAVWAENAKKVGEVLKTGKDCGYITLGDPSLYSTFSHLIRNLRKQEPAVRIEIIPGVSMVMAAANLLNVPLAIDGETLSLIPSAQIDPEHLHKLIRTSDNLVFMKIPSDAQELLRRLEEEGLLHHAIWIQKCCLPGQRVVKELNVETLEEEQERYLSLMIVKKKVMI